MSSHIISFYIFCCFKLMVGKLLYLVSLVIFSFIIRKFFKLSGLRLSEVQLILLLIVVCMRV